MVRYDDIPSSVHPSVCISFLDNSYSFHWVALKLKGQLDHEHILFRGYGTPNFDRVITLFKDFFRPQLVSTPPTVFIRSH